MADDTIEVNLVSTGNPYPNDWSVEFPNDGGTIQVQPGDTDTINWVLETAPDGAAISAIVINAGQPGNVPWDGVAPSAENNWTTTDTNSLSAGQAEVAWSYVVTVTYNGFPYVNDPEIVNDPPTT
ncbi:MAG TPA: hypothetical protein VGQ76_28270 [Thermoanaerobaculia bacterium]|jgi:hypothetical protein|nr:hypothetical protein [Thermoanaerobaculia bacterium]